MNDWQEIIEELLDGAEKLYLVTYALRERFSRFFMAMSGNRMSLTFMRKLLQMLPRYLLRYGTQSLESPTEVM